MTEPVDFNKARKTLSNLGVERPVMTVEEVIEWSFSELHKDSKPSDLVDALKDLEAMAQNMDSISCAALREATKKKLSEIGVKSPAKMVDAALKPQHGQKTDENGIEAEKIEPWPDEVNGVELLQEVIQVFERYLVLPPSGALTQSLWVFASWLYQSFSVFPYLAIISPVKQCGKSNDLDLISFLCNNPLKADSISPSALFRAVEKYHPSLFLDEVDTQNLFRNDELRGILNAGHRNSGCVIRSVKVADDFDVRKFSVYNICNFNTIIS